jgi:hypothetical protein
LQLFPAMTVERLSSGFACNFSHDTPKTFFIRYEFSHNMSKEPWVLSQSLQLHSYVYRASKERKKNIVKNVKAQSHLCWCLNATFFLCELAKRTLPGTFPYPNILYHPVLFSMPDQQYNNQRREVTVIHTSAAAEDARLVL